MHRVFIYGTLKRGFPNHHLLPEARFDGECLTRDKYPLVIAGRWYSPILIAEPGAGLHVRGELYLVNAVELTAFDELEGTDLPRGYERIGIDVLGGESADILKA